MAELDVAIVAVERKIWSGKATFLFSFSNGEKIEVDATLNAIKPEDGMAHH